MAYVNREPKTIISVTSAWDNRVINYGDNVSVVGSKYKDTIENGGYYDNSDAEKGGNNVSKIPDGRLTAGDNFFPVTIRQKNFS